MSNQKTSPGCAIAPGIVSAGSVALTVADSLEAAAKALPDGERDRTKQG
jgi:hypothetical protein